MSCGLEGDEPALILLATVIGPMGAPRESLAVKAYSSFGGAGADARA